MPPMTEQKKKQAMKLLTFANNPLLAVHDQLQEVIDLLKMMCAKEQPPFPEIPPIPEMPEMDMSKMENLLQKLLDKEEPEQTLEATLEIT